LPFFQSLFCCQVAIPDLLAATTGADILVFVLPHQYVKNICSTLKGNIKSNAVAVSLIKVGVNKQGIPTVIRLLGNRLPIFLFISSN
jgi:glycerol-3-phosphate dehydrogenase (NAD+)